MMDKPVQFLLEKNIIEMEHFSSLESIGNNQGYWWLYHPVIFINEPCKKILFQTDENLLIQQIDLDLIFEVEEAGAGNNAQTNVQVSGGNATIRTTLDDDYVNNATTLALARTIIHESVHAYLRYATSKYSTSDTAILLDKYREEYGDDLNISHHEYMTQFTEAMAHSLSVWDNHQQSLEYYNNLAWSGGMTTSDSFNSLSQEQKNAIISANVAEGNANTRATANAKGIKCN